MENKENEFSVKLYSSDLATNLIELVRPILVAHLEQCKADKNLNYDNLGNDREKSLKKALTIYFNLGTTISDLEKVIVFLNLDKDEVSKVYPNLSLEGYYNYHLENYVIRLNIIPDVLAKLGNVICQWGIPERNCYGTFIPNSPRIADENIKEKMTLLLSRISSTRLIRNKKVHTGYAEIDYLGRSLCWDILPTLGIPLTPILKEYSNKKKNEEINLICNEITDILEVVVDILNMYNSYIVVP